MDIKTNNINLKLPGECSKITTVLKILEGKRSGDQLRFGSSPEGAS